MKKNTLIKVTPHALFLPDQTSAEDRRFIWAYDVIIDNKSEEVVQLLNRYWRIVDMTGHVEEVRGPGVVGLQPIIKPGTQFSYNSFCQLSAPQGTMEGYYEMQSLNEERFIVEIPKFILTSTMPGSVSERARLH